MVSPFQGSTQQSWPISVQVAKPTISVFFIKLRGGSSKPMNMHEFTRPSGAQLTDVTVSNLIRDVTIIFRS